MNFMTALNTGAAGAAKGIATADEMLRQDELMKLRQKEDERAGRTMAIKEEENARAGRLGAITERTSAIDLENKQRDQAYLAGRTKLQQDFMGQTGEDGKPLAWTPQREVELGKIVTDYDMANNKVTPEQLRQIHDWREKLGKEEDEKGFNAIVTGRTEDAKGFLKKLGVSAAEWKRDPNSGMFMLHTKDKDGKDLAPIPGQQIAAIYSPKVAEALTKERDDRLKQAQAKTEGAKYSYYTGLGNKYGEDAEYDRRLVGINKELERIHGVERRGIESQMKELDKSEAAIEADVLKSPKEKEEARSRLAQKRDKLEKRRGDIQQESSNIGAVIDNAHESGVKKLSADAARRIVLDAYAGRNVGVDRKTGEAYYTHQSGKLIPIPSGIVPPSVFEKLKGGAIPAAPAAAPAPGAAAPGRAVAPLAEREAELARFNAAMGGRTR